MREQRGVTVSARQMNLVIPARTVFGVPPRVAVLEWVAVTVVVAALALGFGRRLVDAAADAFWLHPTRALVAGMLGIALGAALDLDLTATIAGASRGTLAVRARLAGLALAGVVVVVAILLLSDVDLLNVFLAALVATMWATFTVSTVHLLARRGRFPVYDYEPPEVPGPDAAGSTDSSGAPDPSGSAGTAG